MPLRSLSALLLVVAAAAAPWMAGANTLLPLEGWWFGVLPIAAFVAIVCDRVQCGTSLRVRWPALAATMFLFGCTVFWMFSREPTFATAFSEEHWAFLKTNYPFVMLHWPRVGQLVFLAGTVGAFLAAAELGIDENFRRDLQATIALTGLVVALYALGIRWLGWATPPWVQIAADTEQFNVSFFHHNAPSACLNLAWPLLLWSLKPPRTTLLKITGGIVLFGAV
ncbi:MAG: hypothetical protein ABIO94_13710, partial [Opitutaceae bacterium]